MSGKGLEPGALGSDLLPGKGVERGGHRTGFASKTRPNLDSPSWLARTDKPINPSLNGIYRIFADVAQLVEQLPCKQQVSGSSPDVSFFSFLVRPGSSLTKP